MSRRPPRAQRRPTRPPVATDHARSAEDTAEVDDDEADEPVAEEEEDEEEDEPLVVSLAAAAWRLRLQLTPSGSDGRVIRSARKATDDDDDDDGGITAEAADTE